MRFHLLAIVLMAGVAMPAAAQKAQPVERRVDKLEQEMRAVQRRVFPGGDGPYVGPEIGPDASVEPMAGVPASSAAADLTARVDSLEAQLRELTGQVEQDANRIRMLEQAFNRFRDSSGARLDVLERTGPLAADTTVTSPAPAVRAPSAATRDPVRTTSPAATAPAATTPTATAPRSGADPAEEAYNAGFRLWEQKRYAEAQTALQAMAAKYPSHRLASWANNLAGRAFLDEGKPASAAKILLANYQNNPRGERAADSLYFLGQALVALKKPAEACKAYDEMQDVYGATLRDYLRQRLPAARAEAKCR